MKKYFSILLCLFLMLTSVSNTFAVGAGGTGGNNSSTRPVGPASPHYLLVLSNGVVAAWGDNTYGQCGLEPCDEVTDINYIEFDSKIVKAVAGKGFSIALDENGVAWGWGDNIKFQIGISRPTGGSGIMQSSSPIRMSDNIVDIAVGEEFSILLTKDGEVLYSGATKFRPFYVLYSNENIKCIAANYDNVVVIDEDNIVHYWYSAPSSCFSEFLDVDEVQSVVCGKDHVIIRCLNGENIEYYGFGTNNYKHQLGNALLSSEPVLILSIPYEENLNFTEFAGEYNTVVNVWDTRSPMDGVTEYRWGTDCRYLEDNQTANKATIPEPEKHTVGYQTIALGTEQNIAFDYMDNNLILYGNDENPILIPLIGADEEFSVKDVVSMRRHLTCSYGKYLVVKDIDFNKDGEVSVKDVILLRRFIAGGYGVEF